MLIFLLTGCEPPHLNATLTQPQLEARDRAYLAYLHKDFNTAQNDYRNILDELESQNSTAAQRTQASIRTDLARTYEASGNHSEAINQLSAAIITYRKLLQQVSPAEASAIAVTLGNTLLTLAQTRHRLHDDAGAIKDLQAAKELALQHNLANLKTEAETMDQQLGPKTEDQTLDATRLIEHSLTPMQQRFANALREARQAEFSGDWMRALSIHNHFARAYLQDGSEESKLFAATLLDECGRILATQHKEKEAYKVWHESLEIRKQILWSEHPAVLKNSIELASVAPSPESGERTIETLAPFGHRLPAPLLNKDWASQALFMTVMVLGMKDDALAKQYVLQAIAMAEKKPHRDDITLAIFRHCLADLDLRLGFPEQLHQNYKLSEEARDNYHRAIEWIAKDVHITPLIRKEIAAGDRLCAAHNYDAGLLMLRSASEKVQKLYPTGIN